MFDGPHEVYALVDKSLDEEIAVYEPDRLYALWHEEMASGSSVRVPMTATSLEALVHRFINFRFRTEEYVFRVPRPPATTLTTQALPLNPDEQKEFDEILRAALKRREAGGLP